MPWIFGRGKVHVCSIAGGATIPPKRVFAAASSRYTGLRSSNASTQCRIIGRLTGSGATIGRPIGFPTYVSSRSRTSSFSDSLIAGSTLRAPQSKTITWRAASPLRIRSKASFTSSSPMRAEIISSRRSRPSR